MGTTSVDHAIEQAVPNMGSSLFVGIAFGLAANISALLAGKSIFAALLLHAAFGLLGMIGMAAVLLAYANRGAILQRWPLLVTQTPKGARAERKLRVSGS